MPSAVAGACDGDVIAPYQGSTGRLRLSTAASVSSPMTDRRAPKKRVENIFTQHSARRKTPSVH